MITSFQARFSRCKTEVNYRAAASGLTKLTSFIAVILAWISRTCVVSITFVYYNTFFCLCTKCLLLKRNPTRLTRARDHLPPQPNLLRCRQPTLVTPPSLSVTSTIFRRRFRCRNGETRLSVESCCTIRKNLICSLDFSLLTFMRQTIISYLQQPCSGLLK